MQNRLKSRISKKEKLVGNKVGLPDFQRDFMRQSVCTFPSNNTCVTEVHKGGENQHTPYDMWAMRYTEYKKEQNWNTEVGLRRIDKDTCLVHVKVSCNIGRFALETQTPPLPSVPRFVSQLIADGRHKVFLANENEASIIPVQAGCLKVSSSRAVTLLYDNLIHSCLRRYVIIVSCGNFKAENEAQRLYQGLLGKALVVYLDTCDAVRNALDDIPSEFRVSFNHVRIFYPVEERSYDRSISCDAMEPNRKDVVSSLLSAFVLDNSEAIKTPEDVKHFNALSLAHNQIKNHEAAISSNAGNSKNIEELNSFIEELCKEIDEIKDKRDKDLERQTQETARYKGNVYAIKNQLDRTKQQLTAAYNQNSTLAAVPFPSRLIDVLNYFRYLLPLRLIVHDSAIKSAEAHTSFKDINRAWNMLSVLTTTLYNKKFEENVLVDEKKFKDDTGFELSMTEGKMTKKDSKLDALRKTVYDGKVYDTYPHLKWGGKPPKCLRLHFTFIEEEKKILIGYFGEHLENYSTGKM